MDNRNTLSGREYWRRYTILFSLTAFIVFFIFLFYKKSFVFFDTNGGGDGLVIHYNTFVYFGRYLRTIIRTLLRDHKLVIPMWDLSIGYGQDIIQSLWFYAIGDPFAFLSVFIPTKYSEIGYCVITLLELYCAGAAFSCFCRKMNRRGSEVLIGALIYAFSSYPLYIVILHPYFSLPMIFLPLLLLGAEKVIQKGFSPFYICMLALASFSCFYFFYMLCIFVFLYAVYRYITAVEEKSIKVFAGYVLKFLVNSVIGAGISAVLMLPVVHSLVFSTRVNAENFIPWFYPAGYYKNMLGQVMTGSGGYYNYQGYTPVALICIISLLLLQGKKFRKYKCILGVLALFICIPYVAHVFNGFAYVTNRWIWALDCYISYLVVIILPELKNTERRRWITLALAVLGYIFVMLLFRINHAGKYYVNAIILLAGVFLLSSWKELPAKVLRKFETVAVCLTVFSLCLNAYMIYSPKEGNYLINFGEAGTAYSELTETAPGETLKHIEDNEKYRFDTAGISAGEVKRNSNMLLKRYGTSHYYSTNGGGFYRLITDAELNYPMEQTYTNLDQRSYLDAITGVKYVVIHNGDEKRLPYGYNELKYQNDRYSVYKSDLSLPLVFSSSKLIAPQVYQEASSVQKQQILLQGIAVDEKLDNQTYVDPEYTDIKLDYSIEEGEGLSLQEKSILVDKNNASITLRFDPCMNGELYCRFTGLDYNEKTEEGFIGKHISDSVTSAVLKLDGNNGSGTVVQLMNNQNAYYCGHHDFLANMGFFEDQCSSITISFNNTGIYTFDDIEVYFQPMDHFSRQLSTLMNNDLQKYRIGTNKITCKINAKEQEVVFLSMLYSDAWTAYVDGEKTDILCADSAFMAVPVNKGKHTVILRYRTPWLYEGLCISAMSIALFLIITVFIMRNKASQGRKDG